MYEIPWIGIATVLALFIVLTFMYLKTYEKRRKKNQHGDIDLTRLVVTAKKNHKDIKLM